jgi:hypothetical protein
MFTYSFFYRMADSIAFRHFPVASVQPLIVARVALDLKGRGVVQLFYHVNTGRFSSVTTWMYAKCETLAVIPQYLELLIEYWKDQHSTNRKRGKHMEMV